MIHDDGKHSAHRRARHKHRRQQAAGSSRAERNHQRECFEDSDQDQHLQREIIVQNVGDRVVAHAENARHKKADDAEAERADGRMPKIADREAVELILHPVQQLRESDRCGAGNDSQQQIERNSVQDVEVRVFHREHRSLPQQHGAHAGGERARNHQWNKRARAKFEEQKFDGQDDAGNRRVERGRHSRTGSAREQHFALSGRRGNKLAHKRADRAARLDDGAFRAEWTAGADCNRGRDRLQDCNFCLDAAARREDRFHRFGNSVALDFVRAVFGHEADDDAPDHGHQNYPRSERCVFRAAKMKRPCVVIGKVREQADQVVQNVSDDSREDANQRG